MPQSRRITTTLSTVPRETSSRRHAVPPQACGCRHRRKCDPVRKPGRTIIKGRYTRSNHP